MQNQFIKKWAKLITENTGSDKTAFQKDYATEMSLSDVLNFISSGEYEKTMLIIDKLDDINKNVFAADMLKLFKELHKKYIFIHKGVTQSTDLAELSDLFAGESGWEMVLDNYIEVKEFSSEEFEYELSASLNQLIYNVLKNFYIIKIADFESNSLLKQYAEENSSKCFIKADSDDGFAVFIDPTLNSWLDHLFYDENADSDSEKTNSILEKLSNSSNFDDVFKIVQNIAGCALDYYGNEFEDKFIDKISSETEEDKYNTYYDELDDRNW